MLTWLLSSFSSASPPRAIARKRIVRIAYLHGILMSIVSLAAYIPATIVLIPSNLWSIATLQDYSTHCSRTCYILLYVRQVLILFGITDIIVGVATPGE